jgi:hypothetical protein
MVKREGTFECDWYGICTWNAGENEHLGRRYATVPKVSAYLGA